MALGSSSGDLVAVRGVVGASVPIPEGLAWWSAVPDGADWLSRLPQLVEGCAHDWKLTLGTPFTPGSVAWVAPAELPDGRRAVLKVNFPDVESEHEADALAFWAGSGAVRLLAHDRARRALLVERCEPGGQLWGIEDEEHAYRIAAGVFRELWRPAPAGDCFRSLTQDAQRWARELPVRWEHQARPCSRSLLDEAVALCTELSQSQPELVLCHQDAHGGNMLLAGDRWVVIDPKPVIGEQAFDLASSLRDRRGTLLGSPRPQRVVARRLDQYVSELGVDRGRARGWGIVHALAWGLSEDTVHSDLVACADVLAAV